MWEASVGLTWGIATGEEVCPHTLPKWLTRKHIAVSSSFLLEPRVPLIPSCIHSTNMCQALIIGQTQCWAPIPSQICVFAPNICFCLCLLQVSALWAPYSSQSSLSATLYPHTSLIGPASPEMPTHPHTLVSLPLPLLPRNMSGLGSPWR